MKKVLRTSALMHIPKKFFATIALFCLLLPCNTVKAQVIVETFEGLPWSTRTSSALSCNVVTVATSASKQTITTFFGNSNSQTSTATTLANNSTGSYTWFYSKASISSASSNTNSGHRKHSANLSYMLGSSSGYLIAPILTSGVASLSFWAATSGSGTDISIGVKTNLTNSNLNSSAVTLGLGGTAGFVGYSSVTGIPSTMSSSQFVLTFNVTDPAQAVLFNNSGSTLYIDDIVIHALAPNVTLSSSNPAVAVGGMTQNSTQNTIYSFTIEPDITRGAAALTALTFATTGTYVAADVAKFQLWYSKNNNIGGAVQVGSDIVSSLGTGSHTFSGFNNYINSGDIGYYWITTDVTSGATIGNTIAVSAVGTTDLSFSTGSKTGTAFSGSSLTISGPSNATDHFRTRASGLWSAASTWQSSSDGSFWTNSSLAPTTGAASVLVRDLHTVTIDQSASMASLTIGEGGSGILQMEALGSPVARSISVAGNVTVQSGGKFFCPTQTATISHPLNISGSLIVNGTGIFDMTTATNARGIDVTFNSPSANVTISGSASNTVKFNKFSMDLGSASQKLTSSVTNVTTNNSSALFNLVNGTLEIAGGTFSPASTATITAGTTLSVVTGGTFALGNASLTLNGNLSVSGGTLSIGTSGGNSINYGDNSSFTMTSGSVNIAGRFGYSSSLNKIDFNMSGGTITAPTVDNTGSIATFDIPATASTFTMSGGTIVIKKPSAGATQIDYRNLASTVNITGGTVQFGDASTAAAATFIISSLSANRFPILPNLTINSFNSPTVQLSYSGNACDGMNVIGNVTIGAGATLNAATSTNATDKTISVTGNWINDGGTFTNTGSTVSLNGTGTQTITKTGGETFNNLTVDKTAGSLDLTASSAVTVSSTLGLKNGIVDNTVSNIGLTGGTTVDRAAGTFAANPAYGTGVNVNFSGSVSASSDKELTPASGSIAALSTSGAGTYTLATSPTVTSLTVGVGSILDAANQVITNSGASDISGTFRTAHANGAAGNINGTAPSIGLASTVEYYSGSAQAVEQLSYNNLTLSGAGTKTFAGNTSISGNFASSGGPAVLPATITLTGTVGTQSIAGLAYNNLTINASGGVTKQLTSDASIGSTNTLTITSGTLSLNGHILTLKSNANGTASLAAVTGSINQSVGGSQFSIERYVPAKSARKWSFLAAPVAGGTVHNTWQQQIFVTGAGTGGAATCTGTTVGNGGGTDKYNSNGFDVSANNAVTVYSYDGTQTSGNRWIALGNTSTSLAPGTGYRVNVRGTRGASDANCSSLLNNATPPAPDAVTLSAAGTLVNGTNLGDVTVSVGSVTGNLTLLGNPYPSSIDFDLFSTDNVDISAGKYWFYSPENTAAGLNSTAYSAYTTGSMTNKPTGYTDANAKNIASGQSFFVEKAATGGTNVTFKESHKIGAQSGSFRTQAYSWTNLIRAGLKSADGLTHMDEVLVRFGNVAGVSKSYTAAWDAASLNEGNNLIVSFKDANRLAIQTRPLNFSDDTVKLGVTINTIGNYRLSFSEFETFTSALVIKLRDKFLGTEQDIKANAVYAFSVTNDANSKGDNRFEIVFKGNGALPVSYIGITAKNKGNNDVEVNWQLPSETDVKNYEVQRSADSRTFETRGTVNSRGNSLSKQAYTYTDAPRLNGTSYYRIKATDKSGAVNYSPIVKVSNGKEELAASIYPNPVKDNLNILLQNMEGSYTIKVNAMNGKTMLAQNGNTITGNIVSINTSTFAVGVYMVEIADSKGNRVIEKMVKQ